MLPVVAGLALGLGAMFWLARLMSTLLFGVTAGDPVSYIAAGLAILGTTFVACYLPARRVLRVDPAVSLRMD